MPARLGALFLLLLLLAGCAPRAAETGAVLLVPGGRIVGAWAELDGGFPLPAPPLFADYKDHRLYVAYPYELDVFEEGELSGIYDLPGLPRFLHARPGLVLGTDQGLFTEDAGILPYAAKDARRAQGQTYWLDLHGRPYRNETRLSEESFRSVVADGTQVAFLGQEAWVLEGERFSLPDYQKAALLEDLYLLTDDAVLRYDLHGFMLKSRRGRYRDLAVDQSGVWLLDAENRLVHLDFDLEEAE